MTDFIETDHPRTTTGEFTTKTQGAPEVTLAGALPATGKVPGPVPVTVAGFPDVSSYQFTAAAVAEEHGRLVPYFTDSELARVIEPLNAQELESDAPEIVQRTADGGFEFHYGPTGETRPLTRLNTRHGVLFALNADGTGSLDFEVTEGEWFTDGVDHINRTGISTDNQRGDTFDREWTVRRDDGKYVKRTVTWFVEEYTDDEPHEDELTTEPTYSVWVQTADSISDTLTGPYEDVEYDLDLTHEDYLAADAVFDTLSGAEASAEAFAQRADAGTHIKGWDGYPEL